MSQPNILASILQLNSRAKALSRQWQFRQACELHEIITDRMRNYAGGRSTLYAQSLGNYGLVLLEAGDFDRAGTLLRKSVKIANAAPDASSESRATAANNLGGFYQQLGRDEESLPFFNDALELQRVVSGEINSDYAQILSNIALALASLDRYDEAEPLTKRALEIRRQVLPPMHYDIGQSLNNLGLLYSEMGRYDEAFSPLQESITIYRESLGRYHPSIARVLSNLASLQQKMARPDEASRLFEEALSVAIRSVGKVHPVTRVIVGNFGMLYHDAGLFSDAKEMFEAEVQIAEELQDVNLNHLGIALNHLGTAQFRLEEYSAAKASLQRAIDLLQPDFAEAALIIASIKNNLSLVYLETGYHADAESLSREVRSIRSGL